MTDTDRRTEPAMDAEEWRRALTRRQNARAMMDVIGEDEGAHRRAALALWQQPFGFTWEDVDFLADMSMKYSGEWGDHALRLMRRLEALLPPR